MEATIPPTAIKSAQLFTAKAKHTPPVLHHVQLTMGDRGWHLAAVDEYHLISLGSSTSEDDPSWTLDLDFLAKELKTTDADVKLLLPDDPYEEKGTAQIIHRKGYVRCEVPVYIYSEKRYPEWRRLIPDNAIDELHKVRLDPDFLLDVCKAAKLIGGDVEPTYRQKAYKVRGRDDYVTCYLPFYDIAPDDWRKKDWEAKCLVMPKCR